jgi:AraC-like DNA-binding protein
MTLMQQLKPQATATIALLDSVRYKNPTPQPPKRKRGGGYDVPQVIMKRYILKAKWNDLIVEYGRLEEVGNFDFAMPKHAISVAFTPHERVSWSVDNSTPEVGVLDVLKLKYIKDYIEDNLAEELAIANLAALVPMSQFHFARAFKTLVGEPPHRYILQRRIERAKVLLKVTRLSSAEIAYQVGFSNPSHLSAQFRKLLGVTPKQFRDRV